jgi:molybdate transport system substrate-binding protein
MHCSYDTKEGRVLMRKIYVGILGFAACCLIAGPSSAAESHDMVVSAAVSLRNAFTDIGKAYEERHKDMKITFNFGASGDLVAQIKGGAPVDVFASAAQKDMDALDQDGLIIKDSRSNFVSNAVVLIRPISAKGIVDSFEALKKPDVKKIAMGNPRSVPAGRYADEVFHSLKLSDAIKNRIIFAENVRQVLDYVARNEVDAGVVYATDAKTRPQEVTVIAAAPKGSHKPILYPIGVVKDTRNEKAARSFISFVRSKEGMKILEGYGFKAVQ